MAEYNISEMLPKSEIVEAGFLESMLNNFSSSYKLFWFKGIFTEVLKGNCRIEYKRIVARMIAAAWYPVVFYNLSLGYSDKLADAIEYLHKELHVKREEKEEKIVEFICNSTDPKVVRMVDEFTSMVSFRLIRPFYQREIEYERKHDLYFHDGKINRLIETLNKNDKNNALYIMDKINKVLTVSKRWKEYITVNASVIEGWMNYKLIKYIQGRNPNVPAVPFKIFPPTAKDRNLSSELHFWKEVQAKMPLYDIYTEKEMTEKNYEVYGALSIDHFIPWSFVLHNEIWNLSPCFKNINSVKNNKLPDKERYLNRFCEYQYRAFQITKNMKKLKKMTDQYLTVKADVYDIGESDRGHEAFVDAMHQTIEPLYQIANNQGYGIWRY